MTGTSRSSVRAGRWGQDRKSWCRRFNPVPAHHFFQVVLEQEFRDRDAERDLLQASQLRSTLLQHPLVYDGVAPVDRLGLVAHRPSARSKALVATRCASRTFRSSGVNGNMRPSEFLVSPGSNRSQPLTRSTGFHCLADVSAGFPPALVTLPPDPLKWYGWQPFMPWTE